MSLGWGHRADHSSCCCGLGGRCWPPVEPLRWWGMDHTLPQGGRRLAWCAARGSGCRKAAAARASPKIYAQGQGGQEPAAPTPTPPHPAVGKERVEGDPEPHLPLYPPADPGPRSPFPLLPGDTAPPAPPTIGSFTAQARAGWQHYLQRELSMYLGNKTRKHLI